MAFAQEGAKVVVVDISESGARETARLIEDAGGTALAVICDVREAGQVEAAVDQAVAAFGRIDFAFNNAGVEQPVVAVADVSEADWHRIVGINLTGVFWCMKYVVPVMLAQGGGSIVNTSSSAGAQHKGAGRLCRDKIRRDRPDEMRRAGLRKDEHSCERDLSGNHRHADDSAL
ncbi:SDR family NAD(P)-dependent oxidoreductase [Paraburkholderia sp. SIMBA_030]|uniref:SDR family NAD(P)-dependent oxidoreductase n=1 Tax=Paraburkholderia sp. SIMBA_030 TaxID=3085773 RepID=UPI003978FD25